MSLARMISKMKRMEVDMDKYIKDNKENLIYFNTNINNLQNPTYGTINAKLLRKSPSDYGDSVSTLAIRGVSNPNPRRISNLICKQSSSVPNSGNLTDMIWVWGQFIDHEISLTESNDSDPSNMTTPIDDSNEDYPGRIILFNRSKTTHLSSPREHANNITSFIDGTNVYHCETSRCLNLRLLDGSGKMKTSESENNEITLPFNTFGLNNSIPTGGDPEDFYATGDIRGNENIFLTAMHTLFVREHNRLCDEILANDSTLLNQEEKIFQKAKKMVVGFIQYITYNEFLPKLIGENALSAYSEYNNSINTTIAAEFSVVGYRFGHSMLSSSLRTGPNNEDTILLRNGFFNPNYIKTNGIDNLLLGATLQVMQEIDEKTVEDVRSFLFGPPTSEYLLDLAALNIQRGRDHGIPGYNSVRIGYGLDTKSNFSDVTSDVDLQNKLASLYDNVDDIDPWIGCLVEDKVSGAQVGELLQAILIDQFTRIRDGDRFWYKKNMNLTETEKTEIENTTLADIILRNTSLDNISNDVFKL